MTMLWPVSDDDEYQFRTQVWEVEEFTIDGQEFSGVRGEFAREHEDLQWWTYSFNHVMKGYVPKLGEYIDGCLWLQGIFRDRGRLLPTENASEIRTRRLTIDLIQIFGPAREARGPRLVSPIR
jgi:hypothetical protein